MSSFEFLCVISFFPHVFRYWVLILIFTLRIKMLLLEPTHGNIVNTMYQVISVNNVTHYILLWRVIFMKFLSFFFVIFLLLNLNLSIRRRISSRMCFYSSNLSLWGSELVLFPKCQSLRLCWWRYWYKINIL